MRDGAGGPDESAAEPRPGTAADLVAALWRASPTLVRAPERRPPTPAVDLSLLGDLSAVMARFVAEAELLLQHAAPPERPAVQLLADTARAVRTTLAGQAPAPDRATTDGTALPSSVRLRLARMEQWLAARATVDPRAEPSANLCLWVLDQLEADAR